MNSNHTPETIQRFAEMLMLQEAYRSTPALLADKQLNLPHTKKPVMDFCIRRIKYLKSNPNVVEDAASAIALYTDIFWHIALLDDNL